MKQSGLQFKYGCNNKKCHLQVVIPHAYINSFFDLAAHTKKNDASTSGLKTGSIPLDYIKTHFKHDIINHAQEISLRHIVIPFLLKNMHEHKILTIGDPYLLDIELDYNQDAIYTFEALIPQDLYIQRWKHLPFKATQRKKYRDIDNQVKSFFEEEEHLYAEHKNQDNIVVNDWINFDAYLLNEKNQAVFPQHTINAWLKVGQEEPDVILQSLFVDKKINDTLITTNPHIQSYFCELFDAPYAYAVSIKDRLPHDYFSIDHFKHHFKIKTKKDLHNKLIEVFSFNSDISQRRSIAHNALDLIINKNQIPIPDQAIEEYQQLILQDLQKKYDYAIYKMDPRFDEQIYQLAKKQILEHIITDYIGYQENLTIDHQDIKSFLNLTQRPRTKEFLYFKPVKTKQKGQEMPISSEQLCRPVMREKTLNHIIHHLTRK